jgi:hypothetical protein
MWSPPVYAIEYGDQIKSSVYDGGDDDDPLAMELKICVFIIDWLCHLELLKINQYFMT